MNAEQIEKIIKTIRLIDEHTAENIDLQQLAAEAGVSKFYLHRLFKTLTGKSIMAYARSRKLCMTLDELLNTNWNLIDIALKYGFSHEQSYIRAFKQQYHMTPAQYRKVRCELPVEEKLDIAALYPAEAGVMIEPQMRIRPQFFLQGIEKEIIHDHNYFNKDTNQLIAEWERNYLPGIADKVDASVYFGLVLYNDNPKGRLYAACTQVKGPAPGRPPVKSYTVPTRTYAVFRYVGMHSPYEITFQMLLQLYETINRWKKETAYVQSDGYHMER
ncbi:MAG: helix-turn-helix domain-containing protein, partial [Oscillospiraceae bacterium]|nr:helix-turn-helix domain-containing protein [Oscillospiraceae bacterium]